MQFKPVPFYSKAIFQKIFLAKGRRVALARKPIEEFTREKEKSEKQYKFEAKFGKFAENSQFIGMAARRHLFNYLLSEGTSQYQRKYVIDKIAEQDMAGLAKQGLSKVVDAIVMAAISAKTADAQYDHKVNGILHYPFFWFSQQRGFLVNKDYQRVLIAAGKYAPGDLHHLSALGAYQEKAQKEKIFSALSKCLRLGGPASFKMLVGVYAYLSDDPRTLDAFSDVVLLAGNKGEMHGVASIWWNNYCV